MTGEPHKQDEWAEPEAPDALVEALRELYGAGFVVPSVHDERTLLRARRRLWRQRMVAPMARTLATGAAAAAVGLVAWVALPPRISGPMHPPARSAVVATPRDVDASGRVDILDAFAMARALRDEAPIPTAWDFNGDGLIDGADVDAVALAAVRLPGEEMTR